MVKEVTYRRDDGVLVKTIAYYSYRRGIIGQWMIGEKPLDGFRDRIVSTKHLN